MFSGLKSYFFGYGDEETPKSRDTLCPPSAVGSVAPDSNRLNETSHLLEQTLNFATSKIQEQLILPRPSLEQLQSSSRQQLPTLEQQQLEEEQRKLREISSQIVNANVNENAVDLEDDSSDAWELLDLVDEENVETAQQDRSKTKDHLSNTSSFKASHEPTIEASPSKVCELQSETSESSAVMDESWYVTPPPCFTGSQTFKKPQARFATRKGAGKRTNAIRVQGRQMSVSTSVAFMTNSANSLSRRAKLKLEKSSVIVIKNKDKLESSSSTDLSATVDQDAINRSSSSIEFENLLIEHPSLYITPSRKPSSTLNTTGNGSNESESPATLLKEINLSKMSPDEMNSDASRDAGSSIEPSPDKKAKVIAVKKKVIKVNEDDDEFGYSSSGDSDLWNDDDDDMSCSVLSKSPSLVFEVEEKKDVIFSDLEDDEDDEKVNDDGEVNDENIEANFNDNFNAENEKPIDEEEQIENDDDHHHHDHDHEALKPMIIARKNKSFDQNNKSKQVLQVKPIDREQKPSWQRRKKRANRKARNNCRAQNYRRLESSSDNISNGKGSGNEVDRVSRTSSSPASTDNSNNNSNCSDIIERIAGSSLVSNLSSLANNFAMRPPIPLLGTRVVVNDEANKLDGGTNRYVCTKSSMQRCLKKSYMARQNKAAAVASSNRRQDRRLKMHKTFNGCSVDRKVHTNFK